MDMKDKQQNIITEENQAAYRGYLKTEEKAAATIEKYTCNVRYFNLWLGKSEALKETAMEYKRYLFEVLRRKAAGINAAIAALNSFFAFMGWGIKIKPFKIQKQTFKPRHFVINPNPYARR